MHFFSIFASSASAACFFMFLSIFSTISSRSHSCTCSSDSCYVSHCLNSFNKTFTSFSTIVPRVIRIIVNPKIFRIKVKESIPTPCYQDYFCYLLSCYLLFSILFLIVYVSELWLFMLSLEDNCYTDKILVYKVVSYNQNHSLTLLKYTLYHIQRSRAIERLSYNCFSYSEVITKVKLIPDLAYYCETNSKPPRLRKADPSALPNPQRCPCQTTKKPINYHEALSEQNQP